MSKKRDNDKAGISTGTTKIEPIEKGLPPEMSSSKVQQKPQGGKKKGVSRGQSIKC